jgi:xylulokinase
VTSSERVALGVDLGTSGLKVVALGEGGEVLVRARRSYATSRPEPGAAEQSPGDWLDAVVSAAHEIARTVAPSRWSAIGLSAMLPTLVALDDRARPVGPAITWEDARAQAEGDDLVRRVGSAALYAATGQRVDGRYLLPMNQRRAAATPSAEVSIIAGAKDYLFSWLTGELLTDPSTAAGYAAYDLASGEWDRRLLDAGAGSASVPAIAGALESRPLAASVADLLGCAPGLPVVLGVADSVAGAYGLGVRDEGAVAYIAGSSNVILGRTDSVVLDAEQRYLVTPLAGDGFGIEMDLLSTGAAMAWLARLFGLSGGAAELAALASDSELAAAPLLLPYLAPGEQGALWDDSLVGTALGFSVHTSRAELARGLMAGIIVESRRCLAVLDEKLSAGATAPILVSGSSAASDLFRRDLADASGRPVTYFPDENDHSAIGAALLAARSALGSEPALRLASATVEPRPAKAARWADRAEAHDRLRLATSHLEGNAS